MDGSLMSNGHFTDNAYTRFPSVYNNNDYMWCVELGDNANVKKCSTSAVVCERNLFDEAIMCIKKDDIGSVLTVNATSELTPSTGYFSAQKCIEYCRGGGHAANDAANKYVIVDTDKCTCATGPLNLDLRIPPSEDSTLLLNKKCDKKLYDYTQIGSVDAVTVYNADYSLRYHGEEMAPKSCWAFINQLSMATTGIERFNLQAEPGAPILHGVDCTHTNFHFCEKPLLIHLPNSAYTGGNLHYPQGIKYRNRMYNHNYKAYFITAVGTRVQKKVGGSKHLMCWSAAKCLVYDTVDAARGLRLEHSVYLKITLPKVF